MSGRILYTKPSITEVEVAYATDAARNGWGEHCYDYLNRFEAMFAQHLGVKHAIATSSCTGALHMGLAALGVGPGDEVILADTNWVASLAPILHLRATPVLVDILPDTWCLDPDQVKAAVTARTKAILAVHLYGNLCNMDALLAIGREHAIPVVEDAAEAIGSSWRGQRAGSLGKFGAFSFHGTKTLTTGEGGAFVTNDDDLFEKVLTLSNHGRSRGQTRQFWAEVAGYKFKMSNIQAAIGCGQLERIEELVTRKREILRRYRDLFSAWPEVSVNPEPPGTSNGSWMPTAALAAHTGITREHLIAAFATRNVDARVFFHPLSSLPFICAEPKKNALDIASRAINLPSYHDMTDDDQTTIASVITDLVATSRGTR